MIEIKNLSVSYGEKDVIKDLSFSFKKGFNAIMGPSGSGKSSVAGAILGIVPYSGRIKSDSEKYAAVFQEDRLCEGISVLKNLKLVCRDASVIEDGLEKFNLEKADLIEPEKLFVYEFVMQPNGKSIVKRILGDKKTGFQFDAFTDSALHLYEEGTKLGEIQ